MTFKMAMLLLIGVVALGKAEEDNLTKAALEVKDLLASVPPEIRPSLNNEPTLVKVQTFIRDIDNDDVNGKLTLDLTLRMSWNDYRLAYSTDGVDYVVMLNTKLVWVPDAFFPNGIVTHHKSVHKETFLRIYPSGNITFSSRMSVTMKCPMDRSGSLNHTRSCVLKLASYGYTDRDVIFEWKEERPADFSKNLKAGAYSLDKFETNSCHAKTLTGNYSCLKIEIILRRDTCA